MSNSNADWDENTPLSEISHPDLTKEKVEKYAEIGIHVLGDYDSVYIYGKNEKNKIEALDNKSRKRVTITDKNKKDGSSSSADIW